MTFHQPKFAKSLALISDVKNSPSVGTSQNTAITISRRLSGAFARMRRMRAATVSRGSGTTMASSLATVAIRPPSGSGGC